MPETPAAGRILLVEDNPVNVALVKAVLESQGFQLQVAGDASAAEAALDQGRPDVILMDIQLPGVDGLTLTRRLKADPRTGPIPIIALTAQAMAGDAERARAAGCDGYISKPFQPQALLNAVLQLLIARP